MQRNRSQQNSMDVGRVLQASPLGIAILLLCAFSAQNSCAGPGVAESKQARAEYNFVTGELIVSLNQIYLFTIQSESGQLASDLFDPNPMDFDALVFRNASRVGLVKLGSMNFIERSMGSIGVGIPCSDLTLTYAYAINPPPVRVTAGPNGRFRCVPEPAAGWLMPLAGLWMTRQRWAIMKHNSVRRRTLPS